MATAVTNDYAISGVQYLPPTYEGNDERIKRSIYKSQYRWIGAFFILSGSVVFLLETCFVATMIRYYYGFFAGIWSGSIYLLTGVMAMHVAANARYKLLVMVTVGSFASCLCGGLSVAFNCMEMSYWYRAWYTHDFVMGKGVTSVILGLIVMFLSAILLSMTFPDMYVEQAVEIIDNRQSSRKQAQKVALI